MTQILADLNARTFEGSPAHLHADNSFLSTTVTLQLGPLQDQLGRAEGHVARLVSAVRAALETASGSSSSSAAHLGQQQGTHAPGLQPSLRMLEVRRRR